MARWWTCGCAAPYVSAAAAAPGRSPTSTRRCRSTWTAATRQRSICGPSIPTTIEGERPMAYVDGFVVPVPRKNLKDYRRMAQKAGRVWRDHGAVEFKECVADDVKVGKWTSFPRSVKLKRNKTVVFSWIAFKSRADRDRV